MMSGNKHRGEVPFPKAGEGAFFRFDIASLEKLETKYGDDFINVVLGGFSKGQVSVYSACVAASINNSTVPFPFGLSLEEVMIPMRDALFLALYGRTFDEQQKVEDENFAKQFEEGKTNPRVAAMLSSVLYGKPGTGQG